MIVNGWSDLNKGDCAIVLGLARTIRKLSPTTELSILSEFGIRSHRFRQGTHHTVAELPDVPIYGTFYPDGHLSKYHFRRLLWPAKLVVAVPLLIRSLLLLLSPKLGNLLLSGAEKRSFSEFRQANLIISKGGQFIYTDSSSLRDALRLFKRLYPLVMGIRLKKCVIIYGHSFAEVRGGPSRWITSWTVSRASVVTVRETESLDMLRDLGIDASRVKLVPDSAIAVAPSSDDTVQPAAEIAGKKGRFGKDRVVVNVIQWFFRPGKHSEKRYEHYLNTIASLVDWLSSEMAFDVVLAAHTLGPARWDDDRIAVLKVHSLLSQPSHVHVMLDDLSPRELMEFYSDALLLVGTRLHSTILAMNRGVPVLPISYSGPKTRGIMRLFGLENYVVDINEIELDDIKCKIRSLVSNNSRIRNAIHDRVVHLRGHLEAAVAQMLSSCGSDGSGFVEASSDSNALSIALTTSGNYEWSPQADMLQCPTCRGFSWSSFQPIASIRTMSSPA